MKTSTSGYVFNWVTSLIMAIVIVMLAAMTTAKAQKDIDIPKDIDTIEGLFTPTESQRFFQQGREDFAREVRMFLHPERYLNSDLLQISPELIKQMNQEQQAANFTAENAQYKVYSDREITNQ